MPTLSWPSSGGGASNGRNNVAFPWVARSMDVTDQQPQAWIARSFGRRYCLPLTAADVERLAKVGEAIDTYPANRRHCDGFRTFGPFSRFDR